MYIGGVDERALHHLFAEVLDNSMDEAVAGFADRIEVELEADGTLRVTDNGRGMPVDPHPKFPKKSALEIIMTVLHAGGKFSDKVYHTSGGLHGVGVSVVNALSRQGRSRSRARSQALSPDLLARRADIEACRSRPRPQSPRHDRALPSRRGNLRRRRRVQARALFQMARSKAYLQRGVQIRWKCAPIAASSDDTPAEAVLHFPNGLADFLARTDQGQAERRQRAVLRPHAKRDSPHGRVEWAVTWVSDGFGEADGFLRSYCNTIYTPDGGFHEAGLRAALSKGLRAYAELKNNKKAAAHHAGRRDEHGRRRSSRFSSAIRNSKAKPRAASSPPKRRRSSNRPCAIRSITGSRANTNEANRLLDWCIQQAEDRLRRRKEKEVSRQSATRKLRLPGKLADCSRAGDKDTEIFLVEGDSAGGSAKQARNRETQAILPLRGKILNVASAGGEKMSGNQELADLALALGVQMGAKFKLDDLRYERVIIMTDADVDGAHIASLLITFFHKQMPALIRAGRLFLAMPPLYRVTAGKESVYARDDAHKEALLDGEFKGRKVDISRFKGLGEMMPADLKDTTMNPATRTLARVVLTDEGARRFRSADRNADGQEGRAALQLHPGRTREFVEDVDV